VPSFLKKREGGESKKVSPAWKILIVDDEESIHDITKMALRGFEYDGYGLSFLQAMSAKDAIGLLATHQDIAMILLDVVMESDDAGLKLVEYIRTELGNKIVRIVLRTGQPGQAPEKYVIDNYDINDYKEKTELTQTKLYSCVRTSIQDFARLRELEGQKEALSFLASSAQNIFTIDSFENFFKSVLAVVSKFASLVHGVKLSAIDAFVVFPVDENGEFKMCMGCGKYGTFCKNEDVAPILIDTLKELTASKKRFLLDNEKFIIPMKDSEGTTAIIYAFGEFGFNSYFFDLIGLLSLQIETAFKNIDLYDVLARDHAETINILAIASEYKDENTGEHIKRIETLVVLLAIELGFDNHEAHKMGRASILHDIGKLAVSDSILQKPGRLDIQEHEMVKLHAQKGKKLLDGDNRFVLEGQIAISHHERYDGNGYPTGLSGEDIPIGGRIVAVADVYDALTHERPYKHAWSKSEAYDYIVAESGKQFDPKVVEAFVKIYKKGEI